MAAGTLNRKLSGGNTNSLYNTTTQHLKMPTEPPKTYKNILISTFTTLLIYN